MQHNVCIQKSFLCGLCCQSRQKEQEMFAPMLNHNALLQHHITKRDVTTPYNVTKNACNKARPQYTEPLRYLNEVLCNFQLQILKIQPFQRGFDENTCEQTIETHVYGRSGGTLIKLSQLMGVSSPMYACCLSSWSCYKLKPGQGLVYCEIYL